MSGLNSNYILSPSLQEYFVDKTTGLPLSGGIVTFYKDNSRSSKKSVYELIDEGSGNYSYSALPNPIELSAVGTIQDDDGNDILPYFYPYDSDGNVELYYITVESSENVPQFTRTAWPNLITTTTTTDNLDNFIQNGQFWITNTNFKSTATVTGQLNNSFQFVCPGNFFADINGGTDVDTLTWTRFNNWTNTPNNSPRHAANWTCVTPDSATYKYFGIRFYNVNTFASSTQTYTLGFFGKSDAARDIQILSRKYFGTGGSPSATVTTNVGTINVNTTYPSSAYIVSFTFGDNSIYSIGTNDDDYVDVIFSLPTASAFSFSLTDIMLVLNTQTSVTFPIMTTQDALSSLLGSISTPTASGINYDLPLVLRSGGIAVDTSSIGNIVSKLQTTADRGWLAFDGSGYIYSGISSDLIPYSRLGDKWWDSTSHQYITGNPSTYGTGIISTGNTAILIFLSNAASSSTSLPADGSTTGLSYQTIATAQTSAFSWNAGSTATNATFYVRGTVIGSVTAPTANTSGFTITDVRNNSAEYHFFTILTVAASALAGGEYWKFLTTTTTYYIWYQKDGVGADPAPGGTGIKVNIHSTDSAIDVCRKTIGVLNSGFGSAITCVAGSSITAGGYLTIQTSSSIKVAVYFTVNGTGAAPSVSGYSNILCAVLSTDTSAQVAVKLQDSMNKYMYQVPNGAGLVLMGSDPNNIFSVDGSTRISPFGNGTYATGSKVASLGYSYGLFHTHTGTTATTTTTTTSVSLNAGATMAGQNGGAGAANSFLTATAASVNVPISSNATYTASSSSSSTSTPTINGNGNEQSQPYSLTVNWFVKY